jgi:tetratricopeptide (TPR) repeat protein
MFGVVATHVRNKAQVGRLLWAIAIMGVMISGYSWAQFYGHDAFNLREIPGGVMLGSTMGNSILAGSVLLMSITLSLAAATMALGRPERSGWFWIKLGLWVVIITFQLTALVFAFNRGPWGGTIVAVMALLGLVAAFVGWRSFARMSLVLLLAIALTVALMLKPPPVPTGEPIEIKTEFIHQIYPAPAETLAVSSFATGQISTVTSAGRQVGGGGLSGRIEIWQASARLIVGRPWFDFDRASIPLLRPLIGYGPDMFKYTYLLERSPRGPDRVLISERFAHNFLIHQTVELGILGLLTTLGLFVAPVLVGGYQLFLRGRGRSTFHNLVLVGILAALAGRFVEQSVGVAAVSDLTIFWVLLGIMVALPAATEATPEAQSSGIPPSQGRRPSGRHISTGGNGIFGAQPALAIVVAVCVVAVIGTLTWTKSINYIWAGFEAHNGLESLREAEFQSALVSMDRAINLAPDVSVYHTLRASVYDGYRRQDQIPRERECDQSADGTPYGVCLARNGYQNHREAASQRPFDWRTRLNLAASTLNLALIALDSDLANEAIELYSEVAHLDPKASWHWEWLAAAQLKVDQPEAALETLGKSLAILGDGPGSARSRLLQGMAYSALNDPTAALGSFDASIRLDPRLADTYINRGASYNALGQYKRAIQDLDEAIKLNPVKAMAYNNRGNAYGNLDQLESAVEDYDEAIRLDSGFALAYGNRALAYTYLGDDEAAQADVERGTELGINPEPLLARIQEIKNAR